MTMARETAKERNAREAAERAAALAKRETAYPNRFRHAVALALEENMELVSVVPETGGFTFRDRDNDYEEFVVYDTFGSAGQSEWGLERLEDAAKAKAMRREEERRKYELRKATLAKLTAEEREVLGV